MFSVLGIGNAIVDILARVDDKFLDQHVLVKSNMALTSIEEQQVILEDLDDFTVASGGSVANTMSSLAGLKNSVAFIGRVSDDKWGKFFESGMNQIGVQTDLNVVSSQAKQGSGTSVILITPDGERTMNTHLGVASSVDPSCINEDLVSNCEIVYIEGYLYDSSETIRAIELVIALGKSKDKKIAFTLSDSFCVERHREAFKKLLKDVDILFANQAEFCSLFEINNQKLDVETIDEYLDLLPAVAAITQSERGCTIIENKQCTFMPTEAILSPKDLTGAGDQFAAGFLHMISKGACAVDAGQFGMKLAAKVISKIGPRLTLEEIESIS